VSCSIGLKCKYSVIFLSSLLKNINDQAHEAVLCNQSINGQLLRTTVLIGRLYFGAL
jgi:hypothetical protein